VRTDHRPYPIKRAFAALERSYINRVLAPQADTFGEHAMVLKPWHVRLHGKHIRIGTQPHIIAAADRPVSLTTWSYEAHQGHIDIGDYVLICPGVRIDSAVSVTIGANSMLAANSYITDADWHDQYDRTQPVGSKAAVVLGANVWIGDGAMVCKGVNIGDNAIVGARALVNRDVPANSIVAGNPARVVKTLDSTRELRTRAQLLESPLKMQTQLRELDRYMLEPNGWWNWLRTLIAPRNGD